MQGVLFLTYAHPREVIDFILILYQSNHARKHPTEETKGSAIKDGPDERAEDLDRRIARVDR